MVMLLFNKKISYKLKISQLGSDSGVIIGEHLGFLNFIKKRSTPKMECPYCGGTMLPIDLKN